MDSRSSLDGFEKSLFPIGFRSSDHPARSESLYRLRYPGPQVGHSVFIYLFIYVLVRIHFSQLMLEYLSR